jgi:integrase
MKSGVAPGSGSVPKRSRVADGSQAISPLVFHRDGRQVGNFSKAWKTACGAAGAPQRHLYDFRRSGLRNMVRAGVDPAIAMKVSGHRTRATFDRYNIVSDDDIRDAMAKTSAYLRQQPSEPKVLLLRAAEEKR